MSRITKHLLYLLLLLCLLQGSATEGSRAPEEKAKRKRAPVYKELKAFPSAEGPAKHTRGGFGHPTVKPRHYYADNWEELKLYAEQKRHPRIITCRKGGVWDSGTPSGDFIRIRHPYITIAGHTASGDGVLLSRGAIWIETHDVIIRGLRIYPGLTRQQQQNDSFRRCITLHDGSTPGDRYNIIIDGCDLFYGEDENLDIHGDSYNYYNITVQWCNISNSIRDHANEGGHNFGVLTNGDSKDGSHHHILFHHNLIANHADRAPAFCSNNTGRIPQIAFANNVLYNGRNRFSVVLHKGDSLLNVYNNYYKNGPDSKDDVEHFCYKPGSIGTRSRLYWTGNIFATAAGKPVLEQSRVAQYIAQGVLVEKQVATAKSFNDGYEAESSLQAYRNVQDLSGALLPRRDEVAQSVVNGVANGTLSYVSSVTLPTLSAGTPPADCDNDGLPDSWEQDNSYRFSGGLSPGNRLDAVRHTLAEGAPYPAWDVYQMELFEKAREM